jgi:hypothetical protein
MNVKAEAYQQYNQVAVVDKLISSLPEVVQAMAGPLGKVDKITVVSTGNGDSAGLHKLTGDMTKIAAQVPTLKYWVLTGRIPNIHPAALFLLLATRRHFLPSSQVLLQLALPREHHLGISLARWPENLSSQLSDSAMARHSISRIEVLVAGFLRLGRCGIVRRRHRRVHESGYCWWHLAGGIFSAGMGKSDPAFLSARRGK